MPFSPLLRCPLDLLAAHPLVTQFGLIKEPQAQVRCHWGKGICNDYRAGVIWEQIKQYDVERSPLPSLQATATPYPRRRRVEHTGSRQSSTQSPE